MEFAVTVKGDPPEKARWVLAVDPASERLLVTGDDRMLHWVRMEDCKFAKVADPDQPRPVISVKPQPDPSKLARVEPNLLRGNNS